MRQRDRQPIGTEAEGDEAGVVEATGVTPDTGRLLRFPTRRFHQVESVGRVVAAHDALASAVQLAVQAYGVTVMWEEPSPAKGTGEDGEDARDATAVSQPPPLPEISGTLLVAGDTRRRRLMLSRAGLSALAMVAALGRGPATLTALATATLILSAQAHAVLEVAARVASLPTHALGSGLSTSLQASLSTTPLPLVRGPASTVEWIVAVLAATGLRQIMTVSSTGSARSRHSARRVSSSPPPPTRSATQRRVKRSRHA